LASRRCRLRDIRMRQAADQLRTGDYTLDQIARNAGYSSRGTFVRAFCDVYGTGPTEYRAESADDLHCLPGPLQSVPA
jgi:AraC family transcriptional activator of mtrCDE